MYVPKHFAEGRPAAVEALVRAHPLATIVSLAPDGPDANHIPLVLSGPPAPGGELHGHVPRFNPLVEHVARHPSGLAIFHGPNAYISPSWYATKAESGRVVPTWNYAVVHVQADLRVVDDPAWVRSQLDRLTEALEGASAEPWAVSDAPPTYTDTQIRALVGLELRIRSVVAKTKASQNHPERNRDGVIRGLRARGAHGDHAMADLVASGSRDPA
ncbi:MAG: FMN-binding negative transcriptional regulator [Myxococcota bacterium]